MRLDAAATATASPLQGAVAAVRLRDVEDGFTNVVHAHTDAGLLHSTDASPTEDSEGEDGGVHVRHAALPRPAVDGSVLYLTDDASVAAVAAAAAVVAADGASPAVRDTPRPHPGESYVFVKPLLGVAGTGSDSDSSDAAAAAPGFATLPRPPVDVVRPVSPVALNTAAVATAPQVEWLTGAPPPPSHTYVAWPQPPQRPPPVAPSMLESYVPDLGLANPAGENNCFLNGALQLLWHNDFFRRSVMASDHRACIGRDQQCVLCQLKLKFADDSEGAVPPVAMRNALALLYRHELRFQLQQMDDATECMDAILAQLHQDHVEENVSKRIGVQQLQQQRTMRDWPAMMREHDCQPQCIAHSVFGISVMEQGTCTRCSSSTEPRTVSPFIHFVNVRMMLDCARSVHHGAVMMSDLPGYSFGRLLREVMAQEQWKCDGCSLINDTQQRILLKAPKVLALGLVWDTDRPAKDDISRFARIVQAFINLADMFHDSFDDVTTKSGYHMSLKGMVCFYGRHYVAFQFSKRTEQWMMFDDKTVKPVGRSIDDVWLKCVAGLSMPSLLLYDV